ncbi:hypothetical protein ACC745_39635, partial [Rhizobium ruizarguesonis]
TLTLPSADGGEGWVFGGAVRNSLMGLPFNDVDIATTLRPEAVMERAAAAGIKAVPTGLDRRSQVAFAVQTRRVLPK